MNDIDFSVVIPIFNEQNTISELLSRLNTVIHQIGGSWEVIYVNDGSTDNSLDTLKEHRLHYPYLRIVDLSRNFGHQPALMAGLQRSSGRAVILMDGDLQDSPEALPRLIAKWREGYDVVYAIRVKRKESLFKRALFYAFYRVQRTLIRGAIPLDAGNFSIMSRTVAKVILAMPEQNRYFPGLRAYAGFRQTGVEVERNPRFHGKPRVTLLGLTKLAMDGIFSFSTIPLRFLFVLGIAISFLALAVALTGIYLRYLLGRPFLGWQFGLTTIFFFSGVQLICIGIIGEYVGRIYEEVKRRPYYIERKAIGFEELANGCEHDQ
jgi:glycosyltransferase involved in cell wall biosynthesis